MIGVAISRFVDEWLQRYRRFLAREYVTPAVRDVALARREAEAEQGTQAEDMVGCATGVGVVLGDL
jgi:hypothetical protein